jgi:hypothetical protein
VPVVSASFRRAVLEGGEDGARGAADPLVLSLECLRGRTPASEVKGHHDARLAAPMSGPCGLGKRARDYQVLGTDATLTTVAATQRRRPHVPRSHQRSAAPLRRRQKRELVARAAAATSAAASPRRIPILSLRRACPPRSASTSKCTRLQPPPDCSAACVSPDTHRHWLTSGRVADTVASAQRDAGVTVRFDSR